MNERDWRPRYLQVAEQLREEILSGDLAPGASLPSEPALVERFGLSRTSVRNSIRQLREWGLVRAEQGRGTYVRAPRQRLRRHHTERYQWEKDRVRLSAEERGKTGATEFDTGLAFADLGFEANYSTIEASAELAEIFGVPAGTRMLKRDYLTSYKIENVPLNIVHSYLVYDVVAVNPDLVNVAKEPWPGGTQNQLSTIGIELDRIVDEITARPPLPDEAEILDVEPGVSVLVLRKTSIDTDERVVEFSEVVLPGDRTEIAYTTRLTRWEA